MAMSDDALRALIALSGVALAHSDLEETLREICRIATRAVPNAEGATVTTFPQGRPGALASDDWAQALDELQFEEHEGPCLDAYRTGNAFRIVDLKSEARWPSYVPRALEHGARSILSLPMAAEGSIIGALNLYSREPEAFDAEAASIGEIVSAHAGLASQVSAAFFGHRDLADQLSEAMQSRAVIEQAKGILIAVHRCDADQAFERLVRMSQTTNRKLREVAEQTVQTASAPD
jgi:transcriptional regulator with GAF, ATPase, and Fis domain